jgi:hypothetical protein
LPSLFDATFDATRKNSPICLMKRFNGLLLTNPDTRPVASIMDTRTRRTINDLRQIALATSDPSKREKVLKIIDRFSNQEAWPDQEEIILIRLGMQL